MIAFPVPAPDGVPHWLLVLLVGAAAIAGFTVLVLQTVRFFRRNRDDD